MTCKTACQILMLAAYISIVHGEDSEDFVGETEFENNREEKFISLFNIVSFENNICRASDTRNGTCFTAGECAAQGGSALGTCASGYGVCCIFVLGCGSMSSANCTYIEQSATTSASSLSANPCTYTICKCSSQACRLRLDFTTNVLAPPVTGMHAAAGAVPTDDIGGSLGDCATDFMTLSSPGGMGSPVICGFNSGQHMIVDMSDVGCNVLSFSLGAGSTVSRQWSIKATQFVCNDDNGNGGPPGCLQYFTEPTGSVASYNFDTTTTTVANTATHLSNQQYNICFRQGNGNCFICYTQHAAGTYGLSISPAAATAKSREGTNCGTDFLIIPEQNVVANVGTPTGNNRICGRIFAVPEATAIAVSVCSPVIPFTLGVNFNSDENLSSAAADMADSNELSVVPAGTIGFWLDYSQKACPA